MRMIEGLAHHRTPRSPPVAWLSAWYNACLRASRIREAKPDSPSVLCDPVPRCRLCAISAAFSPLRCRPLHTHGHDPFYPVSRSTVRALRGRCGVALIHRRLRVAEGYGAVV